MQESNRINEVDLQYAKALIELGTEKNIDHREILEMLEVVNKAFLENSDIYKILNLRLCFFCRINNLKGTKIFVHRR